MAGILWMVWDRLDEFVAGRQDEEEESWMFKECFDKRERRRDKGLEAR